MKAQQKSRGAEEIALQVRNILEVLHKWGIHTLGELGKLDKEDLRARLGSAAVTLWERANGQSIRLLKLVQPPESFEEGFEFENEIETIEPLLFILRRFLQQLSLRLNAVYLVAGELRLRIKFSNKQCYERCFKIPQPTNNVELLFRMLHTHLEDFKSEHPIVAVYLDAQPIKRAQQQFGLFETALRDPNQLNETLARLTGLLGADRVGTPVVEETYRPEAFHMEPFSWQLDSLLETHGEKMEGRAPASPSLQRRRGSSALHRHSHLTAALRRFRPSSAASVLLEKNKPVHLRGREMTAPLSDQKGPYLSSGDWWGEKAWARAEWDVELAGGGLLRCHENADGWQVDGIYD